MTQATWSAARCYALEARYEFLKVVRMPAYAIPSVTFPVMFYVLFGLSFGGGRPVGRTTIATYLLATYGAFGVIGAALFGFGVGLAVERGQGWMMLKRATPMPPFAYFTAKLVMCALFSVVIVGLLSFLGAAFGGVGWPPPRGRGCGSRWWPARFRSARSGMAIGYFAGPNSAAAARQPALSAHVVRVRPVDADRGFCRRRCRRSRRTCRLITSDSSRSRRSAPAAARQPGRTSSRSPASR